MLPVKVRSEVVVLCSSAIPGKYESKLTPLNTQIIKDYSFKLGTPTSSGSGANQTQGFYVPPGSLTPVNEPHKSGNGDGSTGGG